jgi:hypothetical protein
MLFVFYSGFLFGCFALASAFLSGFGDKGLLFYFLVVGFCVLFKWFIVGDCYYCSFVFNFVSVVLVLLTVVRFIGCFCLMF